MTQGLNFKLFQEFICLLIATVYSFIISIIWYFFLNTILGGWLREPEELKCYVPIQFLVFSFQALLFFDFLLYFTNLNIALIPLWIMLLVTVNNLLLFKITTNWRIQSYFSKRSFVLIIGNFKVKFRYRALDYLLISNMVLCSVFIVYNLFWFMQYYLKF